MTKKYYNTREVDKVPPAEVKPKVLRMRMDNWPVKCTRFGPCDHMHRPILPDPVTPPLRRKYR